MKGFVISSLLLFLSVMALAQEQNQKYSLELPKDNLLEVNGGFVLNNVIRFEDTNREGDADNGIGYSFGFLYSRKLTDKLWVGGGYSYMSVKNDYVRAPSLDSPSLEEYRKEITTEMWSIPLHVRYNFFKWAYVRPGVSFDFQGANKKGEFVDNQTGLSVFVAAGVSFKVWNSFSVGIEPKVGLTSLAAFRRSDYQQHFITYGATLNVSYLF